MLARAIYTLGRLLEVRVFREENIRHKLLRIAVYEREPRALHMNDDAMPAPKRMIRIGHNVLYVRDLAGLKRFGLFVAIAELAAHRLTSDKLLIASHLDPSGIWLRIRQVA